MGFFPNVARILPDDGCTCFLANWNIPAEPKLAEICWIVPDIGPGLVDLRGSKFADPELDLYRRRGKHHTQLYFLDNPELFHCHSCSFWQH